MSITQNIHRQLFGQQFVRPHLGGHDDRPGTVHRLAATAMAATQHAPAQAATAHHAGRRFVQHDGLAGIGHMMMRSRECDILKNAAEKCAV